MPELPEVETIKRQFKRAVVGREIVAADIRLAKIIRGAVEDFVAGSVGARFTDARRRSKVLILDLSNGNSILAHLRMSGRLIYAPSSEPVVKHTHAILTLDNGYDLRLWEMRQFGRLALVKTNAVDSTPEIAKLGPEPLDDEFTLECFSRILARRPRRAIKALLLDQTVIAGVGNIYADEILYQARVHPTRKAGSLSGDETKRIYEAIRELLLASIRRRGTSVDLYVDLFNKVGENQHHLRVYARAGQSCPCGGSVERIKVAGRGTHYCPRCQVYCA